MAELNSDTLNKTTASPAATPNTINTQNDNAVARINDMYDAQKKANLAQLESGYNQSISELDRQQEKLRPQYDEQRRQLSTQYERNRRNMDMQAAATGLNSGAHTQLDLGASNAYLNAYNNLGKSEAEANKDFGQQRVTLMQGYQGDIAKAAADGDAQRAAALLDEYNNQRQNMMSQASVLAQYGDFSLYEQLYGQNGADLMRKGWAMQNPEQAWAMGYISATDYKTLTGKDPTNSTFVNESGMYNGVNPSGAGGGGGSIAYPEMKWVTGDAGDDYALWARQHS